MDIKCRACMATTDAKMYHSLSSVFPDYFNTTLTVLELLELVTSTSVPECIPPNSICSACLKKLKECYSFIEEFRNSQLWLQENLVQDTTEKLTLKIEKSSDDEEEENLGENFVLQIECKEEENSTPHEESLEEKAPKSAKKRSPKEKTPVKRKSRQLYGEKPVKKNEDGIIVMTIDDVLTEKERTKISPENKNSSSDTAETDEKQVATNDDHSYPKKPEGSEENCYVMSLEDVLNVRTRSGTAKRGKHIPTKNKIIAPANGPYICEICSNVYKTLRALKIHMHTIHIIDQLEKLKCKTCGFQCKTKSAYSHHLNKHKGKQIPCDECPKVFLTPTQLRYHKLGSHQGGLPARFLCNQCGRRFKYVNALIYHEISVHQIGEKKHMCRYCGFKCVQKSYLARHERCHTDERPYKCKVCDRTFRGRSEWQSHEWAHEGITKYDCKYCGKGFLQSWNRKVHWLQHEGDFQCELCPKSFIDNEVLNFHYAFQHKLRVKGDAKEDSEYINSNDDDEARDNSESEYLGVNEVEDEAGSIILDDVQLDFE